MRIANSTLAMSSQHTEVESYFKSEKLQFWTGAAPAANGDAPTRNIRDVLSLSPDAKSLLAENKAPAAEPAKKEGEFFELSEKDKQMINLIEKFIEVLTGKKIKLSVSEKLEIEKEKQCDLPAPAAEENGNANRDPGWGLRYEYDEVYKEAETMSFSAAGSVTTADGRQINLALTIDMSREFVSEEHFRLLAGNAKKVDPLVINFDAATTGLTEAKFTFDLNMDGKSEEVSFVTSGSGLLSLDKNADGVVNDGGELFGPQSGDGFGELAAYDEDGNGWIDENDAIFNQLRIWVKNEAGEDTLVALGEKGIGAIYLGHVATDFALKSAGTNEEKGQITDTGIFLKENGTPGTVQHVDLAV